MPTITLRLRLTIAALTVATALGGALLVSSAPAHTQPPPAFVPTPEMRKFRAEQVQDLANLKVIGLALVMYERDNHYRFPDADKWMDQLTPYLKQIALYRQDRSVFYDPFQPGKERYGYAFNRNCSQKPLSAFDAPAATVAVYESSLGTRNASDTGQSPFLHAMKYPGGTTWAGSGYGFADGHAKWLRPSQGLYGDTPLSFALNGNQSAASAAQAVRMEKLQQFTAGLAKARGELAAGARNSSPLSQAQFLAGLTPVQGPGVVVTLRDSKKPFPQKMPAGMPPPNVIHDTDINQTVNELKAAGAEAIAVNNQRLVATSAIRHEGQTILINNTPQAPPYIIKAIGDPKMLARALNLPGGEADQLKQYDEAMLTVQQAATLTLPAYIGGTPRYAKPVFEPDFVQEKMDFLHKVEAIDKQRLLTYEKQVILTLDSKGVYFLDGVPLPEAQIKPQLAARAHQNPNITAVIKAAKNQPYSRVIKLVNTAKQAGIHSVSLATLTSNNARADALLSSLQIQQDALQAQRDALQVQAGKSGEAFTQYKKAFDAALHQALPQSSAQTFAKARNLEFGIGWNAADLATMKLQATQHPVKLRDPDFVKQRLQLATDLAALRTEEMQLFLKDVKVQRRMAQVHALALHHPTKPLQLQLIDVELKDLNDQIQRLQEIRGLAELSGAGAAGATRGSAMP